jgi:hypothetical protein
MARQGYSYTTSDGVRVVYQTEGEDLKDVPRDGKSIGEIVVRGNLVMREVDFFQRIPCHSVTRFSDPVVLYRREGQREGLQGWLFP